MVGCRVRYNAVRCGRILLRHARPGLGAAVSIGNAAEARKARLCNKLNQRAGDWVYRKWYLSLSNADIGRLGWTRRQELKAWIGGRPVIEPACRTCARGLPGRDGHRQGAGKGLLRSGGGGGRRCGRGRGRGAGITGEGRPGRGIRDP